MATKVQENRFSVQLQRLRNDAEKTRLRYQTIRAVGMILAVALPVVAFGHWVVEPLSGKETIVDANVVVSISIAISLAVNIVQYVISSSRKHRLEEARERTDQLEHEIAILKGSEQ